MPQDTEIAFTFNLSVNDGVDFSSTIPFNLPEGQAAEIHGVMLDIRTADPDTTLTIASLSEAQHLAIPNVFAQAAVWFTWGGTERKTVVLPLPWIVAGPQSVEFRNRSGAALGYRVSLWYVRKTLSPIEWADLRTKRTQDT